jgi:hypothetical protein
MAAGGDGAEAAGESGTRGVHRGESERKADGDRGWNWNWNWNWSWRAGDLFLDRGGRGCLATRY